MGITAQGEGDLEGAAEWWRRAAEQGMAAQVVSFKTRVESAFGFTA